jgi:hypothetical protein
VSNATTLLDGAVSADVITAANNIQDSWGIALWILETGAPSTAAEACYDILIGGATDDVLIASLIAGSTGSANGTSLGHYYFFPIHIPAGKRIAATHANVGTSVTGKLVVWLYGGTPPPWRVGRKITTLGTAFNNARGVVLTVAVSGAAATATQVIASTAEDYFAFLPGFQVSTDSVWINGTVSVGIGVGAATEDRIGTWTYRKNTNESIQGPCPFMPVFYNVPAASRITMLCSDSSTGEASYDGFVYAVS